MADEISLAEAIVSPDVFTEHLLSSLSPEDARKFLNDSLTAVGGAPMEEMAPVDLGMSMYGPMPMPAPPEPEVDLEEQLQQIKAQTMWDMVEEIDDSSRLVFLTNAQAQLIAGDQNALKRMIDVLDLPKPKLVINLLRSEGFREQLQDSPPESVEADMTGPLAGCLPEQAPFLSRQDEKRTQERVDRFMLEVLIPLAAATNAIVICAACSCSCILSRSFTSMFAVERARWGARPPFSIISATDAVHHMYANDNELKHWPNVKDASKSWQACDKSIKSCASWYFNGNMTGRDHDLDPNAMIYLVVDCVGKDGRRDVRPYNKLMTELVRFCSSTLPSLAVKTGMSQKTTLHDAEAISASLMVAMQAAQAGTPLLFLDVRERPELSDAEQSFAESGDREALLQAAKDKFEEACDEYLELAKQGKSCTEVLDVCAIAYFHDFLCGEGSGGRKYKFFETEPVPLHRAISDAKDATKDSSRGNLATPIQIAETANWLTNRYFRDAWEVLKDKIEREERGETYETLYAERMSVMSTFTRTIFASENFHHLSLAHMSIARAGDIVSRLVRRDRLPRQNSLEGMELIRSAWREYDIAMLVASRYKLIVKTLFATELLMGWVACACSSASSWLVLEASAVSNSTSFLLDPSFYEKMNTTNATAAETAAKDMSMGSWMLVEIVFAVSIVTSLLVALQGLLDAKSKWRSLRSGAGTLESIIWLYRARVGPFELDKSSYQSARPERVLCESLIRWRSEVVNSASLSSTPWRRRRDPSVYKHLQDSGELSCSDADDFHSPIQPYRYIEKRVKPSIAFYKQRLPRYSLKMTAFRSSVMLLGVVSSFLARYDQLHWVILVTGASTAITSWSEFQDMQRKTERYNRCVNSLENLLSWWSSLSEVEKASTDNVSKLILGCESTLSEERVGWLATGTQDSNKNKKAAGVTLDQFGIDFGEEDDGDSAKASKNKKGKSKLAQVVPSGSE